MNHIREIKSLLSQPPTLGAAQQIAAHRQALEGTTLHAEALRLMAEAQAATETGEWAP